MNRAENGVVADSVHRLHDEMKMIHSLAAPWDAPLTQSEHSLIAYFLALAGTALFFGLVRAWITRTEVGSRYRLATVARLGIMLSASLSYLVIIISFTTGYTEHHHLWISGSQAIMSMSPRYVEWSIAVPLLTVELLSVTTLTGAAARTAGRQAATGAFLMIFTGFLGAVVIGNGHSRTSLIFFGLVSSGFWAYTVLVLVRAVKSSMPGLTVEAAGLLKQATIFLLSGWAVYPIAYAIQIFFIGGGWTTTMQIVMCVADITVKLGFGSLIHRVAKLRTAEDVRAGNDVHMEAIWISSIKQSDAGLPVVVYIPEGSAVHHPRPKPPGANATASPAALSREDWNES